MLSKSLDKFVPGAWTVDPGDGAFYGPKIDITISDALRRKHQCATIQLDFQLPQRFDLTYRSAEGGADAAANVAAGPGADKLVRPVMIHRAILGSVERFTAILTEHFAGKWPFWLSPRQVVVIPVAAPHKEYAKEVAQKLWDAGLYADADLSDSTLPKKVRNGEIAQYNYIFGVSSGLHTRPSAKGARGLTFGHHVNSRRVRRDGVARRQRPQPRRRWQQKGTHRDDRARRGAREALAAQEREEARQRAPIEIVSRSLCPSQWILSHHFVQRCRFTPKVF